MICRGTDGRYIVKFKYDRSGRRVKTTCSINVLGMQDRLVPATGTVVLDSREKHVKRIARKKALAKAMASTQASFPRSERTAIWESYFAQSKK